MGIRPGSKEFDAIKEFEKIRTRFHQGHCLVTMATGEMSEVEADRAGLVPTHAYAMLDIQEVRVCVKGVSYALYMYCESMGDR